jgi:hypothetical protein
LRAAAASAAGGGCVGVAPRIACVVQRVQVLAVKEALHEGAPQRLGILLRIQRRLRRVLDARARAQAGVEWVSADAHPTMLATASLL